MSHFTHGVVDVWCGGCLVWWMSGVVDVRCGGCLILHTVWWMSGVVDVWCGGCLCGGCRTICHLEAIDQFSFAGEIQGLEPTIEFASLISFGLLCF